MRKGRREGITEIWRCTDAGVEGGGGGGLQRRMERERERERENCCLLVA